MTATVITGKVKIGTKWFRPTVSINLPDPAPSDPSVSVFPPPEGKIFYGASEGDQIVLAQQSGVPLGLDREYFDASSVPAMIAYARRCHLVGSLPVMSIKTPNNNWQEVANGSQDAWLMSIINGFNSLDKQTCWSIHHEPENDVNGTTRTPATFKAMSRYVNTLSTGKAWFGPIIMSGLYNPVAQPNDSKRLILTDWVAPDSGRFFGADGYNHFDPASGKKWRSVEDTFGWYIGGKIFKGVLVPGFRDINADVPIISCEYGVRDDPTGVNSASAWMQESYTYCLTKKIGGMSFFSSPKNVNDGGGSWQLAGSRLVVFTQNANDSRSVHLV